MKGPTVDLSQVVALFQLWTTEVIPAGHLELRSVLAMDLTEVAALAVTLRMFGRRSGFQADCYNNHNSTLVVVSQEDRYDRTF